MGQSNNKGVRIGARMPDKDSKNWTVGSKGVSTFSY